MRHTLILGFFFLLAGNLLATETFSHKTWDNLLQKHVSAAGVVNYEGIQADRKMLNTYLEQLNGFKGVSSLPSAEQEAFWINVYNAYTVALIVDHYPIRSIRDIKVADKDAWHMKIVHAGGQILSLNEVEHKMLLEKFNDPRIHFGINCASFSCPILLNKAFTAANLNTNLDLLAMGFVNDPKRNKVSEGSLQLSEIFNWYQKDFSKEGSVIDFINKYSKVPVKSNAKISYLPYNWNLNS